MVARCTCGAPAALALGCLECGAACCPACAVALEAASYCAGCAATLLETARVVGARPLELC